MANPSSPAVLNALFTTFDMRFRAGFAGIAPTWKKVAMEIPSSTATNTYGWLGQFPQIREWLGDRVINSMKTQAMVVANRDFEGTVGVDRDAIEDDNLGIYSPMFEQLGDDAARFPDRLVYPLLSNGMTSPCYDGQNFFDPNHPVLDANGKVTLVSNIQSGGAGPWWFLLDNTRPVKPLVWQNRKNAEFVAKLDPNTSDAVFMSKQYLYGVDMRGAPAYGLWQFAFASNQPLNSANFRAARQSMMSLAADYDHKLAIEPNLLVYPPELDGTARDLIMAERLANGASNTDWKLVELLKSPYLQ